jgi:hypothetical protein
MDVVGPIFVGHGLYAVMMWSRLLPESLKIFPHHLPIPNKSLIGVSIRYVHLPELIMAVPPGTRSSINGMSIGVVVKVGLDNFPNVDLLCNAD